MKKVCLSLVLSLLAIAWYANTAAALPAFNKEWQGKYVEGNANAAFVEAVGTAKCNVCHDAASKSKKDKNAYGAAVGKYLTKAEYDKIKADAEAAKTYIIKGLEKAEAEKGGNGQSYGEAIKAGKLPVPLP